MKSGRNQQKPAKKKGKKRGPYIPEPKRQRVKAEWIAGLNLSEIAAREDIDRSTAASIVKEPDMLKARASAKGVLYGHVVDIVKEVLIGIRVNHDVAHGIELLERLDVLSPKQVNQNIQVSQQHTPEEVHDYLRRKIAIGLFEGAIEKHKYYGMPYPEAEAIEAEIKKNEKQEKKANGKHEKVEVEA
jgi:hypothetical protein